MRRARLRNTVNLASAQNRRRKAEKSETQELTTSSEGSHNNPSEITSDQSQKETNDTQQEVELPKAAGDATASCSSDQSPTTSFKESVEIRADPPGDHVESTKEQCEKREMSPSRETHEDPYSKKSSIITLEATKESVIKSIEDGTAPGNSEGTGFLKEVPESNSVTSAETSAESFNYHPKENKYEEGCKLTNKSDKIEEMSTCSMSNVHIAKATPLAMSSQAVGMRLGRARFKPNLSLESTQRNRLRRISGSLGGSSDIMGSPLGHGSTNRSHRIRTISNSSATSETEITSPSPALPPNSSGELQKNDAIASLLDRVPATTSLELKNTPEHVRIAATEECDVNSDTFPTSPRKFSLSSHASPKPEHLPLVRKQRRLTETKDAPLTQLGPTVFDVRKADHKKKFAKDVPERKKITMFDLIYYNPSTGDRMTPTGSSGASTPSKCGSSLRSSRANSNADAISNPGDRRPSTQLREVCKRLEEEAEDDPEKAEEEDNQAPPVPQVKIGPDGALIIDEATTVIDTTAAKKAKEDLLKTPLIFESSNMATNYGSWGKKRKNVDWTERETVRFFKALSVFGTDFSMMENVFRRRSRHDLKMKFKKEERSNRALVDRCLSQGLKFDASFFDHESEQEEDEERLAEIEKENKIKKKEEDKKRREVEKKARRVAALASKKKRPKGQSRKKRSTRGYYSSDGVSADEDHSGNSNSQSPTNTIPDISSSVHPDDLDKVLHEALSSFNSAKSPISKKRGRASTHASIEAEMKETSRSKKLRTIENRGSSQSSEISFEIETPTGHLPRIDGPRKDSRDNSSIINKSQEKIEKQPTSLLKKLLVQNKSATSSSTKGQNILPGSENPASSNTAQTFSFPPALLAANPSLANAAPGSIVVVASPRSVPHEGQSGSSNSLNQQLLHVFMVSDDQNSSNSQSNETSNFQRGEKEKTASNASRRLTSETDRSPLRQRKMSESYLDTTSVGRVRTHSGCSSNASPFHMPFSPPMSPYAMQPQLYNIPQDQVFPNKPPDKTNDTFTPEGSETQKQTELSKIENDNPS